jgi:spore coat polysaccharide biosynthesis protein SpsF
MKMANSVINIVAVLQTRMDPKNIHHKAILSLGGKPLLLMILERIKACRLLSMIVVTTTNDPVDEQVYQLCKNEGIPVFRDFRENQLNSDYKIALKYDADVLLKISVNSPLLDPSIITRMLKFYIENQNKYDYVSNLSPASYPKGNEVEIISYSSLKRAWESADDFHEKENSTLYLRNNPDKFRIGNVMWEAGYDYSKTHRWILEYEEDYVFIKKVFDELYYADPNFDIYDILSLLDKQPHLQYINSKYLETSIHNKKINYKAVY